MEDQHGKKDNQQPDRRYASQKRYAAKLRAQGLNPKQFWINDEEHKILKAELEKMRRNQNKF